MAIAVTATTVGTTTPRMVQVEVTGLTVSDEVTITASAGVWTWKVRGADPTVATASQLIRIDNLAAINVPITYTARVNGTDYDSSAVTVTYDADYVLCSLDARTIVDMTWLDNNEPREIATDAHVTVVPGRRRPVVRFSGAGFEAGQWVARTSMDNTLTLSSMLGESAPLVMRTNGDVRDVPAVRIVSISGPSNQLYEGDGGTSKQRVWSMPWVEVDDPYATVAVANSTVADFNAYLVSLGGTVADFNAWILGQGGTVADFNRFDFASEVA